MAGFSYFDATHWKYVNSGTADLLSSSGTTLTDLPASQSKTGSAFYQTTRAKCFDIPATKEIWLKFDVFFDGANRWRAYNENSDGISGICSYVGYSYDFGIWQNGNRVKDFANVCKANQLQSILLHMTSDSSAGIIEAWVDGEKIYSYTGNVNNGDDFADIYLQSEGSGTFFSNVIISNIQSPPISRQVNIKPAIFASALIDLPTAEIDIKPEIFVVVATKKPPAEIYILPEIYVTIKEDAPTAEIDILPEIWATIYSPPQFVRITGDTARIVKKSDSASGDTLREISKSEIIRGDTLRQLVDPSRVFETATADLLCRLATTERVTADTKLNLATSEIVTADTLRKIQRTEIARADTCRALREFARADTLRIICRAESVKADTIIRRPHILCYIVESPTRRLLKAAPNQSLVNSFKDYGVTAFNITLNERTLSDTFNLEIARQMNINDAAQGQLLDYHFSFLVEETSQQGLIQSVKGMYDIDKLLYSQVTYESAETDSAEVDSGYAYPKASEYINQVANYFSLTPNIKIQDFHSSRDLTDQHITYSDLISSLFSWTAQLPQRQINVFIRGNVLHCIQRGLEDSAVDISSLPHSRPTINRKLIRTMWKNADADGLSSEDDTDNTEPFTGKIFYSDWYSTAEITYSNGLMTREKYSTTNNKINSVATTSYTYTGEGYGDDKKYYLASKSSTVTTIEAEDVEVIRAGYPQGENLTKTVTEGNTTYIYKYIYKKRTSDDDKSQSKEIYLFKEYETERKTTYSRSGDTFIWTLDEREISDRQVTHVPAGNGWYSTSIYVNGVHQGSSLSQGKPSNEISQYTVQKSRFTRIVTDEGKTDSTPIDTTSFPVADSEILQELADALQWLNRKTQESVSVEITDRIIGGVPANNHIVDFTERVILDGKEYFLVSNQISFSPRSFIQKLQLVRWF